MRTNVTFSEISNELYNIFSDDRQAAAYMADSFGLDLSAMWDEEHPDDEPTDPTDGGEDSPAPSYGETEKSLWEDRINQ